MFNRRNLLQYGVHSTALGIIGGRRLLGAGGVGRGSNEALSGDLAAQDAKRQAKFKYSLAAYSYRNLLQGDSPQLRLLDFIDDCIDMGLEGTELTSYYFPAKIGEGYLRQLKRYCFRSGLDISGTAVRNDFGFPEGEQRQENIAHVKQWIEHAAVMGAPVIRIFAGHQKQGTSAEESHSLMVSAIEECCDYAGQHGVHLALENHGGPTSTAAGLLKFVADVKSPWFGVNFDSGNFHSEDVYGELAEIAPHALNVQVKVVTSGPDGEKKPTDLQRLAELLKAAGYRGYIVLEYEEGGDPREFCREYLPRMRDTFENVLANS